MRKALIAFVATAVTLIVASVAAATTHRTSTASAACTPDSLNLVTPGTLTIGTDNPAYPPWFGGGTLKGSSWKINDPSTGQGFESAVAYAVAKQLGFTKAQVKWAYTPFDKSYAPGKKSFDFDINQISFTAARAKVVSFSSSYYDVNQSIVVLKGSKIASVHSVAGLASFKLGAQLGTTSYGYIKDTIKASKISVFNTNDDAVQALKNKQIDGIVVDLPTAFYVTAVQVSNGQILGQFQAPAGGEHFGMVFAKGNSLVGCVNGALKSLKANGTLAKLQQTWLAKATGAPVLK